MIANPPSLPIQPVFEQAHVMAISEGASFGASRLKLSEGAPPVIQMSRQISARPSGEGQSKLPPDQTERQERRTFWERVFRMAPLRKRLEKALVEDWKFSEVRPRHIDDLLSEDAEETRTFFMSGSNARQYQRLVKEFGVGFETKEGKIVDESIETLSDYGPELIQKYPTLMEHREIIRRYFAGVFRDGKVGTQSLIKISNSMWFSPFSASKFRMSADLLHTKFQVPNHVIGPMLTSVGDTYWLRQVLFRRTAPQEFQQLLNRIAPSSEDSGNAFSPALQLLVLGAEHKLPFQTLDTFVQRLDLKPKDFGPFSAAVYNLAAYRLASEIKCPTFAQFLRRTLDEFGPEINQESARLFMLSFREFKDDAEALSSYLSPEYRETKEFLRSIGTPVPATVWNMERIAVLARTLTPEKRAKIKEIVRELAEEVKAYRPVNLSRAPASLALFHNHAFKDTFAQRYFGFFRRLFPSNKHKNIHAGPSGWLGADKGDITAAAESELPSFIITKIGHPQNPDGSRDKKSLLVDLDWVIVDRQSGEAFISDRGVFTVPYYEDEELGKLKWPSKKELKRREREKREKCPPMMKRDAALQIEVK